MCTNLVQFQYDLEHCPLSTWGAMEDLVDKGLVKGIGVSNFNLRQIQDILQHGRVIAAFGPEGHIKGTLAIIGAGGLMIIDRSSFQVKPVLNQVECHPYLQQKGMLARCCQDWDIALVAYAPLGSGGRPWRSPDEVPLLEDPILKRIGDRHCKSPAQVALRWNVRPCSVTVPPGLAQVAQSIDQCMNESIK